MSISSRVMSVFLLILGVAIGWALPFFFQFGLDVELIKPFGIDITFVDLVLISLTVVTVLLGALALLIGILAFIGWRAIGGKVEHFTHEELQEALADDGKITTKVGDEVKRIAERYMDEELKNGGRVTKIIEQKVEHFAFKGIGSAMRDLEDNEDESES